LALEACRATISLECNATPRSLFDTRRKIDVGIGKGRLPFANPPAMDTVRTDDEANLALAFDLHM
jgi:hypothetical protein